MVVTEKQNWYVIANITKYLEYFNAKYYQAYLKCTRLLNYLPVH